MSEPDDLSLPTILAIDDKEVNLRLMRAYLQAEPYRVITFTDPREALEQVGIEPPDLILLDLMMPVMDGFAVLGVLKDIAPRVPVLVITGLDERDARLRGLAAGARDYLTKPVDRSELLIRVRNLVALKQAGDALARVVGQLEVANRDLDVFAAGLAHDLQQPITSIAAFAQVLQHRNAQKLSPTDESHLHRIVVAAAAAQRMIRGLLEFARLGQRTIDMVEVDLADVVQAARHALAHQLAARPVHWTIAPLPVVRGDAALLQLAFVNLLSNAVKYSSTREQPAVIVDVTTAESGTHAVRVRDNGVGFDMAHADKLFKPFERLHGTSEFEGTGMGLANVRRIMERHGGTVQAEAAPGQGAAFTLLFRS